MKTTTRYLTAFCAAATLFCSAGIVTAADEAAPEKKERPRQRAERGEGKERPATRPAEGRAAGRGQILDKLVAELNLTDEQKTKVTEIQQEAKEKLKALRGELKDLSPEDRRARIREATAGVRQKIEAVLTDEQKAQLKEKLAAAAEERGEKVKAGGKKKDK